MLIAPDVDAGWPRPHGDAYARNRVSIPGQLAGDPDRHPGFSEIVEIEQPELPPSLLRDVTGDGVPELLLPYRGRVAALDMTNGGLAWQSPVTGVDSIVEFADLDGDGTQELIAASQRVGGGLISLDPTTGAILARTAPLPHRSGVDAGEIAIADLDQDGDDDVIYPAGFFGLAQLWVDGLAPGSEQWSLALSFSGYANVTPAYVGTFAAGSPPSIILHQGPTQQWFEHCPADTPGASCSGALCLCPTAAFTGVHPGIYAFGPSFVSDVDGDGVDELIEVANNPRFTRSLSAFSPARARAEGQGAAGQLWYRDYSQGSATTVPMVSAQAPRDLDADGRVELLVSFADNRDADLDLAGQPIDDGIDHAGIATAVFDAHTGHVDATLLDTFAHGFVDLDGDGQPEFVTSPVSGYSWQTGLTGWEFGCAQGCLEPAWSATHAFAAASALETYDREHLPAPALLIMRVEGRDALLAYRNGELHLLRSVNGQLVSAASRTLTPDQSVVNVAEGFAVLSDGRALQLIDSSLASVGPSIPIPAQGAAPWLSAQLDGFDAPIREGKLYAAPLPKDGSFAAPVELLPHVALSADLDGQGSDEIIDFRRPEDELGPGFEIRALSWEQGQLVVRWSLVGNEQPALDGLELLGNMHFGVGNFDGHGSDDLVFATADTARDAFLVVVDGDSGEVVRVHAAATTPATYTPLLVGDVSTVDGTPHADGIDDVMIDSPYDLELIAFGHVGPVWTRPTDFYHIVGAQADVDGDGRREMIATTSNTLDNPGEVLDFDNGLHPLWGPTQLGLPTGRTQVMSFANIDGQSGLDLLYITGDGALELRNGQTGVMLPGAPVYLSDGQLSAAPDPEAASLSALMVIDVDYDGHDEAIVGADDGWVYALNIVDDGSSDAPLIEWALEVGAPVNQLAAADVDGDGFQELLVTTEAGQGIVLDSLGVKLEITSPDSSCFEVGIVEVSGFAHNIALVDLRLNGVLADSVSVTDSHWTAQVELPGPGEYEIRAEGLDEAGELVSLSTTTITYGGDEDGDGVSACGGDCDDLDPGTNPNQAEVCGDGIDQDCDGQDLACEGEDDGGSFPGPESWDPLPRCNCDSSEPRSQDAGLLGLGCLLLVGLRRRRVRARHR